MLTKVEVIFWIKGIFLIRSHQIIFFFLVFENLDFFFSRKKKWKREMK